MAARPLRDVFTDLLGHRDPADSAGEVLRANGHEDLPDGLIAEAVVNYADTAPVEVAGQLAPFVAAHSPVPQLAGADEIEELTWLEALTSADVDGDLDVAMLDAARDTGADHRADHEPAPLDFGLGADSADPAAFDGELFDDPGAPLAPGPSGPLAGAPGDGLGDVGSHTGDEPPAALDDPFADDDAEADGPDHLDA